MPGTHRIIGRRWIGGISAAITLVLANIGPSVSAQEDAPRLSDGWQSVFIKPGRPGQPMLHIFSQFPISAGHADFELNPPEQFTARVEFCPAEKIEFSVDEDGHQTRVVLCSKDSQSAVGRARGLQIARDSLARDSRMNAEYRNYALALLDEQIATLRIQ